MSNLIVILPYLMFTPHMFMQHSRMLHIQFKYILRSFILPTKLNALNSILRRITSETDKQFTTIIEHKQSVPIRHVKTSKKEVSINEDIL